MPNAARSSGEFGLTRLAQASVECFPRIFLKANTRVSKRREACATWQSYRKTSPGISWVL